MGHIGCYRTWLFSILCAVEKKLNIYPTEAAEVLLLADSVTDSKRKALTVRLIAELLLSDEFFI